MSVTEQIIQTALELKAQEKMLVIGSLMNSIESGAGAENSRKEGYDRKVCDYEMGIIKRKNFKEMF